MKLPNYLLLCSALLAIGSCNQIAAQAQDTQVSKPSDEGDSQAAKKRKRQEDQSRDEKIHDMEKTVAKDPSQANRLALVDFLESLATKCEENSDWPGAWRYYQRAAMVLRDPPESTWEARAATDDGKAATYRKKETDRFYQEAALKALARQLREHPVFTTPSLSLPVPDATDPLKESTYRDVTWRKLQADWKNSSMRQSISDQSGFKQAVIIAFDVNKDGSISDITLLRSCGDIRIDQAAMKVLEDAGKLAPLESGMGSIVHFQMEFGK